MLATADKFYGVVFDNQKISWIRSIKREEAMHFVDQVRAIDLYTCESAIDVVITGGSGPMIV